MGPIGISQLATLWCPLVAATKNWCARQGYELPSRRYQLSGARQSEIAKTVSWGSRSVPEQKPAPRPKLLGKQIGLFHRKTGLCVSWLSEQCPGGSSLSRTVSLTVPVPWDPGLKALCPPETGDQVNPLVAATKTGPSNVSKRSPVGAVGLWSGGGSVTLTPTSWDEAERWCLVGKGEQQQDYTHWLEWGRGRAQHAARKLRCAQLDACLSSRSFKISRWVLFTSDRSTSRWARAHGAFKSCFWLLPLPCGIPGRDLRLVFKARCFGGWSLRHKS